MPKKTIKKPLYFQLCQVTHPHGVTGTEQWGTRYLPSLGDKDEQVNHLIILGIAQ